ncbi:YoaK family protein [Bosea sp. 2YAB26]|uniref:YoaK family protein n=1 Tax=unclassified Bosea (in: a-proteobacteria) TaxID=2653178 RepID=UPI003F8F6B76
MMRYDRRTIGLAVGLTCLAGYVDALGFISLGGFFVSFMTGNTTRLGIELANGHLGGIALAGGIIMLFVGGVVLGSLVGHFARTRRHTAVLAALTICLFIAALSDRLGEAGISIAMLAVAMGMENSVFQRDGEVTIGLTYMTGTLVKMGQRIAGALLGGSRLAWLRHFTLWLGLLSGAVAGALAHHMIGLDAIWLAAAFSGFLTLAASRLLLTD